MQEINYEELNPGIRRVVKMLREAGFRTTDSGDGVTNNAMEGALLLPHVHCVVASVSMVAEARRMLSLFTDAGLDVAPGQIQAVFDPMDGVCTLSVYGIKDEMLPVVEPC